MEVNKESYKEINEYTPIIEPSENERIRALAKDSWKHREFSWCRSGLAQIFCAMACGASIGIGVIAGLTVALVELSGPADNNNSTFANLTWYQ
ncbi:MAG: hypothetical protein AB7F31_04195 [Parachlamydiales bacterium]